MIHSSQKPKIIAVSDNGVITAFHSHFPGLVVQGNSHDDVAKKMDKLLDAFIKRLEASRNNLEIETTSLA